MHISYKKRFPVILTVVVGVLLWCGTGMVAAAEIAMDDFPFHPGERQMYKLRWGLIPAGYAELEVLQFEQINGESVWHFSMSVKTSEFVDLFYKVRDRIESFTDLALANSKLYNKEQREGRTERDVVIRFDQDLRSAVYSNNGVAREAIKIEDGTVDPLASLFYIRKQLSVENQVIKKYVTDGKKVVLGIAKVVRREKLTIHGVEYDTFLVEPDLKEVRGVFEKSRKSKLKLWITTDDRRLLVKMKSKVVVGSFTGTLIEATVPSL